MNSKIQSLFIYELCICCKNVLSIDIFLSVGLPFIRGMNIKQKERSNEKKGEGVKFYILLR